MNERNFEILASQDVALDHRMYIIYPANKKFPSMSCSFVSWLRSVMSIISFLRRRSVILLLSHDQYILVFFRDHDFQVCWFITLTEIFRVGLHQDIVRDHEISLFGRKMENRMRSGGYSWYSIFFLVDVELRSHSNDHTTISSLTFEDIGQNFVNRCDLMHLTIAHEPRDSTSRSIKKKRRTLFGEFVSDSASGKMDFLFQIDPEVVSDTFPCISNSESWSFQIAFERSYESRSSSRREHKHRDLN